MNISKYLSHALFMASLGVVAFSHADVGANDTAPAFTTQDATGKTQKLSDYAGKWIVLEWFNQDCPFVKKQYNSGNMQKLQKTYTAKHDKDGKGLVWFSVLSSAKSSKSYINAAEALKVTDSKHFNSSATAILLDPSGTIGHAYGAKTTPHMFVINPQGKIVYSGAIDSNDSADPAVIPQSTNYVAAALDAGMNNQPIKKTFARPYGCGVKYADAK